MSDKALKRGRIQECGDDLSPEEDRSSKRTRMVTPQKPKVQTQSTPRKEYPRPMTLLTQSFLDEEDASLVAEYLEKNSNQFHCPPRGKICGKQYRLNKFFFHPKAPYDIIVRKHLRVPEEFVAFIPIGKNADKFLIEIIQKLPVRIEDDLWELQEEVEKRLKEHYFIAGKAQRLTDILSKLQSKAHIKETLRQGEIQVEHTAQLAEHSADIATLKKKHGEYDSKFEELASKQDELASKQESELEEVKRQIKLLQIANTQHGSNFNQLSTQVNGQEFQQKLASQERRQLRDQQSLTSNQCKDLNTRVEQNTRGLYQLHEQIQSIQQFGSNLEKRWKDFHSSPSRTSDQEKLLSLQMKEEITHLRNWVASHCVSKKEHMELNRQVSIVEELFTKLPNPIYYYTLTSSINHSLRSGDMDEKSRREVDAMRAALKMLPLQPGITYRGMDLDQVPAGVFASPLKNTKVVCDPGFWSSSRKIEVAWHFAKLHRDPAEQNVNSRLILRIEHKTGRYVKQLAASEYEWEEEVIFQPGTKFEVLDVGKEQYHLETPRHYFTYMCVKEMV